MTWRHVATTRAYRMPAGVERITIHHARAMFIRSSGGFSVEAMG